MRLSAARQRVVIAIHGRKRVRLAECRRRWVAILRSERMGPVGLGQYEAGKTWKVGWAGVHTGSARQQMMHATCLAHGWHPSPRCSPGSTTQAVPNATACGCLSLLLRSCAKSRCSESEHLHAGPMK